VRNIAAAFLAVSCLLFGLASNALASHLDSNFGENGIVTYNHGGSVRYRALLDEWVGQAKALAIDSKGRILVGGGSGAEMVVLRYLSDGTLDPSFAEGGVLRFYERQTTGSGFSDPDLSEPRVKDILLKPDGSIVVLAQSYGVNGGSVPWDLLYWFTESGEPDISTELPYAEQVGNLPESLPRSAQFAGDGNILIAGQNVTGSSDEGLPDRYEGYVMKRNAAGEQVDSFGGGFLLPGWSEPVPGIRGLAAKGDPPFSSYTGLKVLKSGKILAGGHKNNRLIVTRMTGNGKLDPTFGPWKLRFKKENRGSTIANFGGKKCRCANNGDIATDNKGRIYQVGVSSYPYTDRIATLVVVRYLYNGAIDRSFGKNGFARIIRNPWMRATSIAVQKNGRIVVAARYGYDSKPRFMLARFMPNGKLDRSFFHNGVFTQTIGDASTAEKVLIDRQGRILVAGGFLTGNTGNFLLERIAP